MSALHTQAEATEVGFIYQRETEQGVTSYFLRFEAPVIFGYPGFRLDVLFWECEVRSMWILCCCELTMQSPRPWRSLISSEVWVVDALEPTEAWLG